MNVRARAGLRFVTWLVAVFLALAVAGQAVGAAGLQSLTGYAILDVVLLAVTLGCWWALDRRSPTRTPLAPARAPRALVRGGAIGVGLVVVVVAILALLGAYELAPRACRADSLLRFLAGTLAFVGLAALFEEALFRGYGLFSLRDLAGPAVAVGVTSFFFAILHQANPGFGWQATANLALVGVVLGFWVLAERDVWVAVGAHAGWNAAIVIGAAVPVSGLVMPAPCHAGILEGPGWLTGGAFGLEAGLPTAIVWIGFGLWLWRRRSRRRPGAGA